MLYTHVMIRYGELTLKGKNKKYFINTLSNNIIMSLKDIEGLKFIKQFDRFYVGLDEFSPLDEILNRLSMIPGIFNYSLVKKVNKDINEIKENALILVKEVENNYKTFKVHSSRSDKEFPLISDQINREVASIILKNTSLSVDVHNPELEVKVEVRNDACYITTDKYQGLGGLPLGCSGSGLLMISGGIDSPVAGFKVMKKGIKVVGIHYSSPPYTSEMALFKVKTLLKKLAKIQGEIKFINIPFTELQLKIYEVAGDKYAITLMRRMMFRIASEVAKKYKCQAIVTGESVGQVASQTLDSMVAINDVTNMPIIRPLVTSDKLEIINVAKQIDTYETSILPYEDCCTIFDPKSPTTKPSLKECLFYESKFDYQQLINKAIEEASIETITL